MNKYKSFLLSSVLFLFSHIMIAQPPGAPDPQLSLPWPVGEAWWLHNGPHHNSIFFGADDPDICNPSEIIWSSIDLAPGPGAAGAVHAARSGWIIKDNCTATGSFVKVVIDHGDGWFTGYYHLTQIPETVRNPAANATWINKGEFLGFVSLNICCDGDPDGNGNATPNICDGATETPHLHFSVRYDPNYPAGDINLSKEMFVDIDNLMIGGWQVNEANCNRFGDMTRQGRTIIRPRVWPASTFDPASLILNDGTIGQNNTIDDGIPGNNANSTSYTINQDISGGCDLFSATLGTVIINNSFSSATYNINYGEEGSRMTLYARVYSLLM